MNAPHCITDSAGKKLSVILPLTEYEKLLKDSEELEDIRLYTEAITDEAPSIPVVEIFERIEAKRKK